MLLKSVLNILYICAYQIYFTETIAFELLQPSSQIHTNNAIKNCSYYELYIFYIICKQLDDSTGEEVDRYIQV